MILLYECGICDCLHPWDWDGDCRDDSNRYATAEDFADFNNVDIWSIEVRSMDDRVTSDIAEVEKRTTTKRMLAKITKPQ